MPEAIPQDLVDLRERLTRFLTDGLSDVPLDDTAPADAAAAVRDRSRSEGFFKLMQPKAFGGEEVGILTQAVIRETIAAANSPLGRFVLGPPPGMLEAADGSLREQFLEPVLRGELRGAFAFTEPSGPDAPVRPSWAVRDGDELVITGQKSFVTGAATADFMTALVNVDEREGQPAGTAMVVIPMKTPGVTLVRRFESLDGGHHASLTLTDVRAPMANVLGKIGEGMPRALRNITDERMEQGATACGLSVWAVEHVTKHISAPHPSGTRLGDREGVRLRYSDLRIETYAARAMLYRAARLGESGEDILNDAMATKVFCTEVLGRIVDGSVQLTGGQALIVGHPLEALYRRVRSLRIAGGASDVLRLNVVRGRLDFDAGRL